MESHAVYNIIINYTEAGPVPCRPCNTEVVQPSYQCNNVWGVNGLSRISDNNYVIYNCFLPAHILLIRIRRKIIRVFLSLIHCKMNQKHVLLQAMAAFIKIKHFDAMLFSTTVSYYGKLQDISLCLPNTPLQVDTGFTENLHAVLCIAENAVGPTATVPDDVHQMYSGQFHQHDLNDENGCMIPHCS